MKKHILLLSLLGATWTAQAQLTPYSDNSYFGQMTSLSLLYPSYGFASQDHSQNIPMPNQFHSINTATRDLSHLKPDFNLHSIVGSDHTMNNPGTSFVSMFLSDNVGNNINEIQLLLEPSAFTKYADVAIRDDHNALGKGYIISVVYQRKYIWDNHWDIVLRDYYVLVNQFTNQIIPNGQEEQVLGKGKAPRIDAYVSTNAYGGGDVFATEHFVIGYTDHDNVNIVHLDRNSGILQVDNHPHGNNTTFNSYGIEYVENDSIALHVDVAATNFYNLPKENYQTYFSYNRLDDISIFIYNTQIGGSPIFIDSMIDAHTGRSRIDAMSLQYYNTTDVYERFVLLTDADRSNTRVTSYTTPVPVSFGKTIVPSANPSRFYGCAVAAGIGNFTGTYTGNANNYYFITTGKAASNAIDFDLNFTALNTDGSGFRYSTLMAPPNPNIFTTILDQVNQEFIAEDPNSYPVNYFNWDDFHYDGFHMSASTNNGMGLLNAWFDFNTNQVKYDYKYGNIDYGTFQTMSANITFDDLKLYPNPAKDVINIQNKGIINEYSIIDMTGKQILNKRNINDNVMQIDVSQLPIANYIIRIHSENAIKDYKFVKE